MLVFETPLHMSMVGGGVTRARLGRVALLTLAPSPALQLLKSIVVDNMPPVPPPTAKPEPTKDSPEVPVHVIRPASPPSAVLPSQQRPLVPERLYRCVPCTRNRVC